MELSYLTAEIPGTGGVLKTKPEDFRVTEIPLYEPNDEGTHTFFHVEKHGTSTPEAVRRIGRALRVPETRIGYAGLKDARAVTRQVMSLEHVPPEEILALRVPNVTIAWARRHTNKIRVGHLVGNRFEIRVRNVVPGALECAERILDVLRRRGAPNYFGRQRFGTKGDGHLVGKAIVQRDFRRALDLFLGTPSEREHDPTIRRARELYHEGKFQESLEAFPYMFLSERRALGVLARTNGDIEQALWAISRRALRLFVSAYQSYLYNAVLEGRLPAFDRMRVGDLAYLHDRGACFLVEDLAAEQPRCDRFEISPTAPIFGSRMMRAGGEVGREEQEALEAAGVELREFAVAKGLVCRGERRAIRIPLTDITVREEPAESALFFEFTLPRGCYATSVLREVTKTPEESIEEDEAS